MMKEEVSALVHQGFKHRARRAEMGKGRRRPKRPVWCECEGPQAPSASKPNRADEGGRLSPVSSRVQAPSPEGGDGEGVRRPNPPTATECELPKAASARGWR